MRSCFKTKISLLLVLILIVCQTGIIVSANEVTLDSFYSNNSFSVNIPESFEYSPTFGPFFSTMSFDSSYKIENMILINMVDNSKKLNIKSMRESELKKYYLFNINNDDNISWQWSDDSKCKINGYDCYNLKGSLLSGDLKYSVDLYMVTSKDHIIVFGCAAKDKSYFDSAEYKEFINSLRIKEDLFSNSILCRVSYFFNTMSVRKVIIYSLIFVILIIIVIRRIIFKSINNLGSISYNVLSTNREIYNVYSQDTAYGNQKNLFSTNCDINGIDMD